jgi:uncharacterized protein YdhG (YjbR/CyaY superfamily)
MGSKKDAKRLAATGGGGAGFSAEERAAMRERARELRAEGRAGRDREAGERAVLAKVAELPEADRVLAQRIHAIVKAAAPELSPKTWYGMPAYANRDGKVVCYFTPASRFSSRYATFGFTDHAHLDEGNMWPTSFALKDLTPAEEARITALVRKAVS